MSPEQEEIAKLKREQEYFLDVTESQITELHNIIDNLEKERRELVLERVFREQEEEIEALNERNPSFRDRAFLAALQGYSSNPVVMKRAIDDWEENGGPRPTCIAEFLVGLANEVADEAMKQRGEK